MYFEGGGGSLLFLQTSKFSSVMDIILKNALLSFKELVTFAHTDFATEKSLDSAKKASRLYYLIFLAKRPSAPLVHSLLS